MNKRIRTAAATTLLAGSTLTVGLLAAPAAHADTERNGRCGGGTYELSAGPDDGRYEVSVDLDRVAPGTRWRVVVKHEGRTIANVVRTADREGDVEVERAVRGTAGSETFSFRASRLNAPISCSRSVTVA